MRPQTGLAGARAPAGFVGWALLAAVALCSATRAVRADDAAETSELGARARVRAFTTPETLGANQLEVLRRGLGDNFNPTEALPGALLLFSGVPYLMVRGAPPAASTAYLDGVPVPALYHMALGTAITHPALLGELQFHPGVAPARYGRHTGAVLSATGAPAPEFGPRSEVELRLLDAQGLTIAGRAPSVGVHARVGYPAAMLALTGSNAVLGYWDYHARFAQALGPHDQLELAVFGAGDQIGDLRDRADDVELEFHRALLRLRRQVRGFEFGASLYFGLERGVLGRALTANGGRIGPQLWFETQDGPGGARLRVGADMEAKLAHLERGPGSDILARSDGRSPSLEEDAVQFLDRAPLSKRPARSAFGGYAELQLSSPHHIELLAGARADVWLAAGQAQQALDPRFLVRVRVAPPLVLHAGIGTAHQAAASPLPVPGLADFEVDTGLQSALQGEVGARWLLPAELTLAVTGFYHAFEQLVFLELLVDCEGNSDPRVRTPRYLDQAQPVGLCARRSLPRGAGRAYGTELTLARTSSERFNGWLGYTWAHAEASAADGTRFVPQFDVRHLLNLVLAYSWGAGFESGLRLHFRSGKPAVNTVFDFAQSRLERVYVRLPPFLRLDLNLGYHWTTRWGGLWITLQWLNMTFAREATKRDCRFDASLMLRCEVDYQPAVVLPNAGLRAVF